MIPLIVMRAAWLHTVQLLGTPDACLAQPCWPASLSNRAAQLKIESERERDGEASVCTLS